jgi:hypothetical protein
MLGNILKESTLTYFLGSLILLCETSHGIMKCSETGEFSSASNVLLMFDLYFILIVHYYSLLLYLV